MPPRFISEPIKPVIATIDSERMALGEPGLAREFLWREETITILEVLRVWRETGPCTHGSGEQYVRKHWYEVRTNGSRRMKIYFERQPRRSSRKKTERWWLFSIEQDD